MPRRNHKTRAKSRFRHNTNPSRCGECNVAARRDGSGKSLIHHQYDCSIKASKR